MGVFDSKREELIAPAPEGQTLGTLSADAVKRLMDEDAGPPPWQTREGLSDGDARNFVTVPGDWVLRWLNPRLIDLMGWRDWKPVMASDPRIKVHVKSCVDVGNNVRRGGHEGDVLAYMPKHWYDARVRQQRELNDMATQASVDKQATLKEEFARGRFGRGVRIEDARHPTHTIADLKGISD